MAKKENLIHPKYCFKDMPLDKDEAIADYRLWQMKIHGSTVYGEVLLPNGSYKAPRPLIIFFHGFPGGHRSEDIASALRRAGCVAICPNHRGAWGSQGKFLISNCVEDAMTIARWYHDPKHAEEYHINPDLIFLAGHSMGGNTCINAAKELPWLKGIILLAPGNMYVSMKKDPKAMDNLLKVGAPMLNCDGPAALKKDLEEHPEYDFVQAYEALKDMNICLCLGSQDPLDYKATIQPLWDQLKDHKTKARQKKKVFPCGHGFCNARIAVTRYIAEFVKDVCEA